MGGWVLPYQPYGESRIMAQFANVLMVIDLTNNFLKAFKLIKLSIKKTS